MKKLKAAMVAVPLITLVIIFAVIRYISVDRVETYPAGMTGNTAGNLNNGGYFCEYNGVVYFANAYDGYTLYRMNADETELEKLSIQTVKYLNAAGSHLYYYQTDVYNGSDLGSVIKSTGLYRCKTDGSNIKCLKRGTISTVALADNFLYYLNYDMADGFSLYKMTTSGDDDAQVAEESINPACVNASDIYFPGVENDHNLYRLNTATDSITRIWTGSMWNPVVLGNYVYYMDLSNGYAISRLNLTDGNSEILVSERVDLFNVSDNYIFYQTADTDEPALKRVNLDGSGEVTIAYGTYRNLSITSQYLYYSSYLTDMPVYHVALNDTTPRVFDGIIHE